ncbi:MAG TPA: hypothetical protein VNY73_09370 [Bacteroidia bacterium]|jgi:hypothetical protein|nr:hypothetical protein [Bacteroidia bacterium]
MQPRYPILLLLLVIFGCSPAVITRLNWQSAPVVADGRLTEWQAPLRFYDPDTKLNYVVSNDKENLYVCIRAADEQSQMKIIRGGMQVWIDTTGKKKKQVGISFPLSAKMRTNDGEESPSEFKRSEKPNMERLHKKITDEANEMLLTGFKQPLNGYTARQNTSGLKLSINWDTNNIMIYEAIIPFSTFYKPTLTNADSLKTFGFSIVVNGLAAPERKDDGGSGGANMGGGGMGGGGGMSGNRGGMGGGMGGGRGMGGGGMRGGGGAPSNPMYETNSFWIRFRLASK